MVGIGQQRPPAESDQGSVMVHELKSGGTGLDKWRPWAALSLGPTTGGGGVADDGDGADGDDVPTTKHDGDADEHADDAGHGGDAAPAELHLPQLRRLELLPLRQRVLQLKLTPQRSSCRQLKL